MQEGVNPPYKFTERRSRYATAKIGEEGEL